MNRVTATTTTNNDVFFSFFSLPYNSNIADTVDGYFAQTVYLTPF